MAGLSKLDSLAKNLMINDPIYGACNWRKVTEETRNYFRADAKNLTSKKTKFVVLAISGDIKAFGVMTQKDYSDWDSGKKWKDKPDIMSLMFGNCEAVDTHTEWQGVMQSVLDANGEIVDVEVGVAY